MREVIVVALLILGLFLFAAVHLVPSLATGVKASAVASMGENGYKGVFSLLLLASFGLMIAGWRSAEPVYLYSPPPALRLPAMGLIALGFLVMGASARNSRIRRVIRHPQLTGVFLWAISHLVLNGDSRSVVLFGALAVWSVVEILAINRREGVWIKEPAPGWGAELVTLLIAVIIVAALAWAHPWLSGVAII
jgi:uncharacterized membrane protein